MKDWDIKYLNKSGISRTAIYVFTKMSKYKIEEKK